MNILAETSRNISLSRPPALLSPPEATVPAGRPPAPPGDDDDAPPLPLPLSASVPPAPPEDIGANDVRLIPSPPNHDGIVPVNKFLWKPNICKLVNF